LQLDISSVTASGLRIDGSQVVDIDQARSAITSLDNATDMVNQERSYLGSMQNRLAFTMSNLTSQTHLRWSGLDFKPVWVGSFYITASDYPTAVP